MEQALTSHLMNAAKAVEDQLDAEINRLDKLDGDELEKMRAQRLEAMKRAQKQKAEWRAAGHGEYREISDEKEFFEVTKRSNKVVCHFYRDSAMRCKIFDKHLELLAPKHLECRFVKLNAEKAPFLTERLKIRVIPTLGIVVDSQTKDFVVGFDDLGGIDDFNTDMLEWRLGCSGCIDYSGDLLTPPDQGKPKKAGIFGAYKKAGVRENDDSDDEDDW